MSTNHNHGTFIEVAGTDLAFRQVSVFDSTPTGSQILGYCNLSPREDYLVLQWLPSGDMEELRPDETIALADFSPARFVIAKSDRSFRFVLNDRSLVWPERAIKVDRLRILGAIDEADRLFLRRDEEEDRKLQDGEDLSLAGNGVEKVYSRHESWKLNVQGVVIRSPTPTIVVRAALDEAGFDPNQGWIIVLKTKEGRRQVTLDDVIDLRDRGIEKLRLTPREINNGEVQHALRRDFRLLPNDEAGLTTRGFLWETILDGGHRWLLLRNYTLPEGYTVAETTIALDVPPSYPTAEIDMFYCAPHLACPNGRVIPQTQVHMTIAGVSYQRWSRHRGSIAPWRPGVDSVLTHLALVDAAILREVEQ